MPAGTRAPLVRRAFEGGRIAASPVAGRAVARSFAYGPGLRAPFVGVLLASALLTGALLTTAGAAALAATRVTRFAGAFFTAPTFAGAAVEVAFDAGASLFAATRLPAVFAPPRGAFGRPGRGSNSNVTLP